MGYCSGLMNLLRSGAGSPRSGWWWVGLTLGIAGCGAGTPGTGRSVAALPQDPALPVYFNQRQASRYQELDRPQTRSGDNLEQVLLEGINQAQISIDVAVQELRLPRIAQALADRHRAGVRVRVVLENQYSRPVAQGSAAFNPNPNGDEEESGDREQQRQQEYITLMDRNGDGQLSPEEINQGDALVILDRAQVPRLDDTADGSKGSGLMHHKFIIIDGAIVLTGSANFTPSDIHGDFRNPQTRGNANHLLRLESPGVAAIFQEEFNLMWGDGPGGRRNSRFGTAKGDRPPRTVDVGSSRVTMHFSPIPKSRPWADSSNGLIAATLSQARRQVDLALFVFTDQTLANTLQQRHRQGVDVRVLIDRGFAFRDYSEGLDLLGVTLPRNCKPETGNQPWNPPITSVGVPQLPDGDLLHHKFGVMDGTTVITGSHNWSASANHQNDETLLVIESPVVAAQFEQEFDRLYGSAQLGLSPSVQDKINAARQQCGTP